MKRLYIAAYDVRQPSRLAAALREVRAFASGGQYSAYECWLERQEVEVLKSRMQAVLDLAEDSFALIPVAHRAGVTTLGVAVAPADPEVFYFG